MLLSIIRVYPSPENEHATIDVLSSMKGPLSALTDCLDCFILSERAGDNAVCYMEIWKNSEGLNDHLRSALYARVLEAMELSQSPPIVEFFELKKIGGLEWIESIRTPMR
ncbi:putative quinol monooxygenase [Desulfopila aestuarii]|uniref:Quinol monooxygenase YgiN n=1 Tax=Desulfopila aestuarii DSM 18488 TaxID=1121416 RepID=A0A1M7YL12_9BACT|nr:antibiotic biosynthesis monooxygenase [Desulfopila aestuarii]SHO53282.1 Quinol monooxygenase YgiN [Desulfopila aestuarii DSM 18488]